MEDTTPKACFTVTEFGNRFHVSKTTIFRMIKEGELETVKVRRKRLIPVESAEAWWANARKAS